MKTYFYSAALGLLFLLLSGSALVAQSTKTGLQHLQITRLDDSQIDAYLQLAATDKKVPLLVMCQGSGTGSMTSPFMAVTKQFNTQVARLVIEKAGVRKEGKGETVSDLYKEKNLVHNRLYDYLRVLQHLRATATWWNGELYIIGGSEGGLLAGMVASFYPDTKAVGILGFGGGMTFGEAWPLATRVQKKAAGATEPEQARAENAVRDTLQMARLNPTFTRSFDGRDNTYGWWASITGIRLQNALLDLAIPIYVGHGAEDVMMPVQSARRLQEEFARRGKTNLYFTEYPGYDHGFTDQAGNSHYAGVFIDTISKMLGSGKVSSK